MATIKKTAAGTFTAVIRRPRFGVRYKAKTFHRRYDAEGWARKVESEIERGAWREIGDAEHMTLGEALARYAREESPRHRGVDIEQATIRVMQDEPLCRLPLARIDKGNMRALRDSWKTRGYAVGTINRRLTLLHAMYELARDAWDMPALDNPVAGQRLKGETRRERRVSDDEIDAVIAASSSPALGVFIRLAVETAMRRGELCALTWSMLDLDKRVAKLPASVTKSSKARDVPLSKTAAACLSRQPRGEGTVFGVRPHSITRAMNRAAKRARATYIDQCHADGVELDADYLTDLHFHDLRHEATSRLAKVFALHELMKIVGHSSSTMLERYYHPSAEDFAKRI